jgi:hypothetical protein
MKLRKYHDNMKWIVPIECDADYGRSWDVDFNVTDKKEPAGYTHVTELENYVPEDFDLPTIKNLLKALTSGDEVKRGRAKAWLEANLHPRAFASTMSLFDTNAKAGWPLTDKKEIKRVLIAVLQLHEYWTIDNVPDGPDNDDKLETLAQYEQRMGVNERDPACDLGYMGAIPLDANVIRPEPQILGDEPAPVPTDDGGQPPLESTPQPSPNTPPFENVLLRASTVGA